MQTPKILTNFAPAQQIMEGKRTHSIHGTVIRGKGLGRLHDMPTANLRPDEGEILPEEGVWATSVLLEGKTYRGLTNVGPRPTVDEDPAISVETMIIDFDEDLYGKEMTLIFRKRIRSVMKFSSLDALRRQIAEDMKEL